MALMQTKYILFEDPHFGKNPIKEKWYQKFAFSVLSKLLPVANPDFDCINDKVKYWFIEFGIEDGSPQREIGLNEQQEVIVKMPHGKNYGFWTDSNMLLKDFYQSFQVSEVTKEEFEDAWGLYE